MMEVQPDVVIHDDLADDDGEAEEEEEEPRQHMEHPDDNGEFKNAFPLLICTWVLKNQVVKIKLDKLDF